MVEDVRVKMRGVACGAAVLAAVVLASCGSSASTAKPGVAAQTTTATTTTAPTVPPVVTTASNATLGSLLADASGKTLYTLTNAGSPVACTGQCLTFWPPLLLPAGSQTASGAAGVTGLGTVAATGGMQVTENGAPLYRFSVDAAPGDAKGEGISSFGGVWHVVKVSGAPSATVAPKTTTAPTTTSGGGYSYP